MSEHTRKSFYIFLTMLLGVLLFVTVQRSVFLLVFLLGEDISSVYVQALYVLTTAIGITVGAWYGVWLGLLWYRAIYEEGTTRSLFGVIKGFGGKKNQSTEGEWEIDDLVALESIDPKTKKPTVEYMEAGAVKWHGKGPFGEREYEVKDQGVFQKKRVAKKALPHKRVVKKTVS